MKTTLLFWLLFLALAATSTAQVTSHRMRFHYRLTNEKLNAIGSSALPYPVHLTNSSADTFRLCPKTKVLEVLVAPADKDGALLLDVWSIIDYRVNKIAEAEIKSTTDPVEKAKLQAKYTDACYDSVFYKQPLGGRNRDILNVVNANTDVGLKLQFPKRKKLGDAVFGIWLPYQTIIVSINTIAFKTRPAVTDFNGKKYPATLTAGSFNLGLGIGKSFGWTKFTQRSSNSTSLTGSFSLGLSNVKLKDEPLTRSVDVAAVPNSFVLSPTGTLTVARNDIGFILAFGIDHMFGNAASAWAYQNEPFFGFGIAAGFKL